MRLFLIAFTCFLVSEICAYEYPTLNEDDAPLYAKNCRKITEQKFFCRGNLDDVVIYDLENKIETTMYEKATGNQPNSLYQPHSFYQYQCKDIQYGLLNGSLAAGCKGSKIDIVTLFCLEYAKNIVSFYDEDGVETYKSKVFPGDENKCRELFQIIKTGERNIITKDYLLDSLKFSK